ncbi:carbohydrate ABC transporter permease [Cohnella sp. GCM10020058]|uniref:carbohydrate ABC transporter permease n=1 Tax=Cohnella sp. GCM10020058 TaxID=3317330 RepID=UPI003641C3EF
MTSRSIDGIVLRLFGLLIAFVALFPLLWAIIAGFKSDSQILAVPFRFFPKVWDPANYVALLGDEAFLRSLATTFLVAGVTTVLSLFFNSLAAFAFARMTFPFKKSLWAYVMIPLFVPAISILIPSYIIVSKLHLVDSVLVLMLPFIVGVYGVFFIRQFYLNVPSSYEEAAIIDGASYFQVYTKIFWPLSHPPFVIVGVGSFLGMWNSFVWPIMTISDPKLFQIMQLLAYFRNQYGSEIGMWLTGSTIAALPIIILFLVFQKYIIEGLKISGLK